MVLTKAHRQQVVLLWVGIGLTWGTTLAVELLLLGARAPLAMVITTALSLVIGILMTRRTVTPRQRAEITVRDLRDRRRRRELTR
jgi:hypothetical protein